MLRAGFQSSEGPYSEAPTGRICDQICEKGSYTCIRFSNFDEA